MRLKDEEKQPILQAIHCVDPHARVYLFGSRVDDSGKGGDIDIIVTKDGGEPFVQMVLEQGVELL